MVMANTSFVFVSYARADREPVSRIVDELKRLGVETWVDSDRLAPGDAWEQRISYALREAEAFLVFISPAMMGSKWMFIELEHALTSGARILPVLLSPIAITELPLRLRRIQYLDATVFPPETFARSTAEEIARVLRVWSTKGAPEPLEDAEREGLAKAFAAQTKGTGAIPEDAAPTSVFLVHGHDEELLHEVVGFFEELGIRAIVLEKVGAAARSLIDKFFEIGGAARFAIVLLSADDMGASRDQFEEPDVGAKALKYRSRQNTILELGYFYGLLGWDKVFVLEKTPPRKFPDFERPSDLNGVVFDRYDLAGKWKETVAQRMEDHGFILAKSKH
jgi:predicted nucleotide-binding protein